MPPVWHPALDHMLDELEQQRLTLSRQLHAVPATSEPVVDATTQWRSAQRGDRCGQDHTVDTGGCIRRELDIDRPPTGAESSHLTVGRWQIGGIDHPWPPRSHPGRAGSVARGLTGTAGSTIGGICPHAFGGRVQVCGRQNKIPLPLRGLAGRAGEGMDVATSLSGCRDL